MKNEILAIIPARGGSKGVPRKNIKELDGKPLIAWTIEAALKSKYIDRVVVSTEDREISIISEENGAEVPFLRPLHLSNDDTPTIDVIVYTINELKKRYNYSPQYVILLQCTSPLRNVNNVDEAIERFINNKECDSLVSVSEVEHTPYWNKMISKDGYITNFIDYDENKLTRRQQFESVYRLNGAIYISSKENLVKFNSFLTVKTIPYIMSRKSSIDIDDIDDFGIAEYFLKNNIKIGDNICE